MLGKKDIGLGELSIKRTLTVGSVERANSFELVLEFEHSQYRKFFSSGFLSCSDQFFSHSEFACEPA